VLKAALSASIGQTIQPDLANDPIAFANAVSRFTKWSPDFGNGYDPGWKYQNRLADQAAAAVVSATLQPALLAAQSKAKLIQNDEYSKLSQVIKEAGAVERRHLEALQSSGGKVSEDLQKQYRAAMERKNAAALRMKEIEFEISPESRWHTTVGWNAEDYFDDPQVIKLCQAIERNDIPEMERLIAAGADANAIGKGGMTPLLWAFPDGKLERFRCLLERGANPNVTIENDFGVGNRPLHPYPAGGSFYRDRGCAPGQSVTHLAARSPEVEYLTLVLTHRGDPNVVDKDTGMTPLDMVVDRHYSDARVRVELLVTKGADVNHYCQYKGGTPTMLAVQNDLFDTALFLLQSGADPELFRPDGTEKLAHFVVRKERRLSDFRPQLAADYRALVEWLERNGESLAAARADQEAWDERFKKALEPSDHARIRQQIIRDQKRRNRPEAAPPDSAFGVK
jgi:hypothetical protein